MNWCKVCGVGAMVRYWLSRELGRYFEQCSYCERYVPPSEVEKENGE